MLRRHPRSVRASIRRGIGRGLAAVVLLAAARLAAAQDILEQDRLDTTGRQNLTLGSGARAYGMGGAFLARADDATAASWNPAGLSYLRLPELSLVGVANSFSVTSNNIDTDTLNGKAFDFAAFTWPVAIGGARGAIQLSYQRAISFDGRREIKQYDSKGLPRRYDDGSSDGGFDVIGFGTGLRLTRHLRAGLTVNRWFNGYTQTLHRQVYSVLDPTTGVPGPPRNPLRDFALDFRPDGWSANFGLMWSPVESLNIGAVYKTGFSADVEMDKSRADGWGTIGAINEVTTNAHSSDSVQMEFPRSYGFGASWRPRETLTLSADFTLTRWSKATILNYFNLPATPESVEDVPSPRPDPQVYGLLQYPTLQPAPTTDDPTDQANGQQDKQEIRVGVEWVLIKGAVKVPLRAGYFSDRQITPDRISGDVPRFNGFTAGIGVALGPVLLDVAWVYEFGSYYTPPTDTSGGEFEPAQPPAASTPLRNAVTTNRGFASIIYRFR